MALARQVLDRYAALPVPARLDFFRLLARDFGPDPDRLRAAWAAYDGDPAAPAGSGRCCGAVEPPRQELFRRLNLAPGGTAALVRMREELLGHGGARPGLAGVDDDLAHLLSSWFNRGFLVLRRDRLVDPGRHPRAHHPLRGRARDPGLGRPAPPRCSRPTGAASPSSTPRWSTSR